MSIPNLTTLVATIDFKRYEFTDMKLQACKTFIASAKGVLD